MKVAWTEITRSNREVKENAHTPADLGALLTVLASNPLGA
jgi:hypothetical protein